MNNTFQFNNHSIGIRVFDGIPYFCAKDMALACEYRHGLPIRSEDKAIKSGSYNYISLHRLGYVLSRATGKRRPKTQELLEEIQKEFRSAIPVPTAPIYQAPIESDYDLRIKRNQIEIELDELRALEASQASAIYDAQKQQKMTLAKIYERERELAELRQIRVVDLQRKAISNG